MYQMKRFIDMEQSPLSMFLLLSTWFVFSYVFANSNWVHPPGNPRGLAKKLPGGSEFDFWILSGGREFDKGGDFVEIQSETFCPCIGFISDKYRVSQKLLKNGEHYIDDFQFKPR